MYGIVLTYGTKYQYRCVLNIDVFSDAISVIPIASRPLQLLRSHKSIYIFWHICLPQIYMERRLKKT